MTGIIESLKMEKISLEETITKHIEKGTKQYVIDGLKDLHTKVQKILSELESGADLKLLCACGFLASACEFNFYTDVQTCNDCGNHIKIIVTCPKCGKERTVYRDRVFEGE